MEGAINVLLLGTLSLDWPPPPKAEKIRIPSQGDGEGIRMFWCPLAAPTMRSKWSKRVRVKCDAGGDMLLQIAK